MIILVSLMILFISSGVAARSLWMRLGVAAADERLAAWIGGSILFFAWCLGCTLLVAGAADLAGLPLVRVPVVASLSVVGAMACRWRVRRTAGACQQTPSITPLHASRSRFPRWACAAVVLPVIGLHAFLLLDAVSRPPSAFDGLRYHLPMIVRWVRDGRLSVIREIWQYCCPSNGELWLSLFAAARMESWIEPAMLPLGMLTALCTAGIARELGATVRGASVAGLLVLVSPMFALQMYSSYVDLFAAAFLTGSLYWVLRAARPGQAPGAVMGAALLAGLALGLSLGSKIGMIAWSAPVVLAMFAVLLRLRGGELRARVLVAFVAGSMVCSSYWYARSAYEMGWFLHPICVRLGGWTFGVGGTPSEICTDLGRIGWHSLSYPWLESKRSGYPYTLDNGLGPVFVGFAVTGVAYLVYRRVRQRGRPWFAELAVLGSLAVGTVLFVEVCFSYPRYALPLWLLMFAAAGPLVDLMLRWRFRCTVWLLSVSLGLSCAMIGLGAAKPAFQRWRDAHAGRAVPRGAPSMVEDFAPGTVILNLNDDLANYPLLGARWSNVVIESMFAASVGLQRSISRRQLADMNVDVVYQRGQMPPPFAADVEYALIYDQREHMPEARSSPARMYRVNVKRAGSNPVAGGEVRR